MSRIVQKKALRGSQKWLQEILESKPELISRQLAGKLGISRETICWLSPLSSDGYAEYRDQSALQLLGVDLLKRPLSEFWPTGGPVWDGLGTTDRGDFLLVEAKAHITEMVSGPSMAGEVSLVKIQRALAETKSFLGVRKKSDWTKDFYQYANRLAHLYLLRKLNGLPAWLIFIHFVGDQDMVGPSTCDEWIGAIKVMKQVLGLSKRHRLEPYVIDLFIDVRPLHANGPTSREL